jgi:aminopeptidase N
VPLALVNERGQTLSFDFKTRDAVFEAPEGFFSPTGWVKANPRQTGFYRVCYSSALLEKLHAAVSSGALPAVDRWGLLNDAFALARAGIAPTTDVGSFLFYF